MARQASGTVGPYIISGLLEQSFEVSVLTREDSAGKFPGTVKTISTDYTEESLAMTLHGQDAVISTIGHAGLDKQFALIDAAEKAGVKRFIPSEFGSPKGPHDLPEFSALLKNKLAVVQYLEDKARENNKFTWSVFTVGTFLDRVRCCVQVNCAYSVTKFYLQALATFPDFGFDLRKRSATIFDSGSELFTAVSIEDIGRPVATSLIKFEETKNRYINISSLRTNQNEILSILEQRTGVTWEATKVRVQDVLAAARNKLADGDFKGGYVGIVVSQMYEDGAGRAVVSGADNELLGTPKVSVNEIIERAYSRIEN